MQELIRERIQESIAVKEALLNDADAISTLEAIAEDAVSAVKGGGKVLVCGNGGSASDSLHMVGEIVGRFQCERNPWPAIALNSDVATMTAIANDYGYDEIFARQVDAHAVPGDLFLGISTSGNSRNVLRAAEEARKKQCRTAALLGKGGGLIKDEVGNALVVPCDVTSRIQESHIMCIHIICEIMERELA